MTTGGDIPNEEWARVQRELPIACADVVPVLLDASGAIRKVGLVRRATPFGDERWCHVGGRIHHGETALAAASRHLHSALERVDATGEPVGVVPAEPRALFEFFPDERSGHGFDPRKHAVSACFQAECVEGIDVPPSERRTSDAEALAFAWFSPDGLPDDDDLWPGARALILKTVSHRSDAVAIGYTALQARAISRDELTWQTPALAMTAQAFLMTISLAADSSQTARVVASLLSALVSLLGIQLLAKHSSLHHQDFLALERLEQRSGLLRVHAKPVVTGRLASARSRQWWQRGMAAFGLTSVAIAVVALGWPGLLE